MSAVGPSLPPGSTVPGTKYRIVKSLGAGGMGVVYQVVKPPNIGGVLKLMSTELTAHVEHRTRFFDEVRILAQLDHPNIVKVYDYDALPDGTPFYVMELLSGRTVRDVLESMGRVPPRIAYEITRQLLDALEAAHTHEVPVVHRDIKPENIFLHAPRHGEPVVKLIDFGVSAVADRQHDGTFVGTWSYAAPEQIRGELPTAATDLYAVGLVLYEMLAGRGPFDHHATWEAVSIAQLQEIPAPVSQWAPWVPPSIVALVQAALAKEPRTRPRSAWEFAEKLYDLEWANDGAAAAPLARPTVRGPTPLPAHPGAAEKREKVRPDTELSIAGTGPLAKMLTSVAGAFVAPAESAASAAPAGAGPAGAAPAGAAPATASAGGAARAVGAGTNALLDGLGAPRSGSNPRFTPPQPPPGTPTGPQPAPRAQPTAVTLDEPLGPRASHDTFSSQSTDARALPRPRTRALVVLAACVAVVGLATAGFIVVRSAAPRAPAAAAATATVPAPSLAPAPATSPPTGTSATTVIPSAVASLAATPPPSAAPPPPPSTPARGPIARPVAPPVPPPPATSGKPAPKKHSEFTEDF